MTSANWSASPHSEVAVRVLIAISEGDPKSALQAINEAVNAGQDPRQLNRQIVSLIRDGLYIASGARGQATTWACRLPASDWD